MSNQTHFRFEWDEAKNLLNQQKHRISFQQAAQVFDDPLHSTRQDRIENDELRWQTLGLVAGHLLLLVAHTVTERDEAGCAVEVIRLMSARKADRTERRRYEEQNR